MKDKSKFIWKNPYKEIIELREENDKMLCLLTMVNQHFEQLTDEAEKVYLEIERWELSQIQLTGKRFDSRLRSSLEKLSSSINTYFFRHKVEAMISERLFFYKSIFGKYNLSLKELKTIAYMLMGIDPNKMNIFLGCRSSTLRSNRYRIKKKLGLTKEQDLNEALEKMLKGG